MLHIDSLTLSVAGRTLCDRLSLNIEAGQCWAILGSNGSGKTTLLNTLAGLRQPEDGSVALNGQALATYPRTELARALGVLLQEEPGGFWGDVLEYVLLGRHPYGDRDVDSAVAALRRVGLEVLMARRYPSLSGGERQRVRIAQLLAQECRVCLLDEPLQHLDLRHQAEVMALFRDLACQEGRVVVMVLHEPWWAVRFCSHALLQFGDGNLLYGEVADLLVPAHLERLYGCRLPPGGPELRR